MAQLRFALVFLVYAAAIFERTDALCPAQPISNAVTWGQSPYTLQALQVPATPGSPVIVTIGVVGMAQFQGFIVRAKNDHGSGVGQFVVVGPSPPLYQAVNCAVTADTATHTNLLAKSLVKLQFVPPSPGTYRFFATIIRDDSSHYPGYEAVVNVV